MKETKAEKLYMLRLWQEKDEEVWRASLKPVGQVEGSVKYFHTLESFVKFLGKQFRNTLQNSKNIDDAPSKNT